MKRKNQIGLFAEVICAGAALLLCATTINLHAQYTYTTISVPGAVRTEAWGISGNNIVGSYSDGTTYQGFLYNGSGYATLSVPGAVDTFAAGISGNNIVGRYDSSDGSTYGFLYDMTSQTYITLSFAAFGISGDYIVGGHTIYDFVTQTSTTLSVPEPGFFGPAARGISGNDIVGFYTSLKPGAQSTQGFLYDGSSYTTLSVPGAVQTSAFGNSGNNIVGWYQNSSGAFGFLYNGSDYITLNVPGASSTVALGICGNDIVGAYVDSQANGLGFLATPVPEPSLLAFWAVGATTFVLWVYRNSLRCRTQSHCRLSDPDSDS